MVLRSAQQGEGIVDVTTHLVDLVQWEAFPESAEAADAKVLSARRWATPLTPEQFGRVTGAKDFLRFSTAYVKTACCRCRPTANSPTP